MPTYAYECKSCGHSFDVFQNMSDEPLTSCPQCGKELRRLINGGSGVIFKGSGFYVTDRKGPGTKTGSASGSGDKPAESTAKPADSAAKPAESAAKPADSAGGGCAKAEPGNRPAAQAAG
ncbi:MAG: zinc ribbon domain-containing protein [Treponema sp.]|jgi:putative FmdB family regulatory protein|nr:zinc ribbon domain-containing protein [Treponema sp.]